MFFTLDDIKKLEKKGCFVINDSITISLSDVNITSVDVPGCIVSSSDEVTIALDVNITKSLKEEGLAREFVNRIQNLRKNKFFNVTDRIVILIENNELLSSAIQNNLTYICNETLAEKLEFTKLNGEDFDEFELVEKINAKVSIKKQ